MEKKKKPKKNWFYRFWDSVRKQFVYMMRDVKVGGNIIIHVPPTHIVEQPPPRVVRVRSIQKVEVI
jgi:uncharacterized membrane protein YraQ (UPF0718 family)